MATANSIQAFGGGVILYCHAKIDSNLISYNTCISKAGNNSDISMGGGISCISQAPYFREIIMENNTITHNSVSNNSVPSNQLRAGGVIITGYNGRMTRNEICNNEIWDCSNLGVASVGVNVGACPDSFLIESNIIRNNAYKYGTGDCYGGGLHLWGPGSSISVINNLITGNSATIGGGVVNSTNTALSGRVVFVNNTIINNIATYGGGIYFHNTTAQVMNTIIWGNQAPTNAAIHAYTSTIYVAYSNVQGGWSGTGNIDLDPQLVGDSLSDSSPCIGKGIASYDFGSGMMCHCPGVDIVGNSRPNPVGSNPDMGAWESPLSDPITEVLDFTLAEIPKSYFLAQNYPNPFNAMTTIKYELPESKPMTLEIYNITGHRVRRLVNSQMSAGYHSVVWDGRDDAGDQVAGGIYLYRIQAGEFQQTRRMSMLK